MKSLTNQHSGICRICKLFDANILNKSSKLPNYHGNYFTQDPIGWQATLIWKIRSWGKILDESMKANSTYNAHQICGQSFGLSMSYMICKTLNADTWSMVCAACLYSWNTQSIKFDLNFFSVTTCIIGLVQTYETIYKMAQESISIYNTPYLMILIQSW